MSISFHLQSHVDTLYREKTRRLAFNAHSPAEFETWKQTLRSTLRDLLCLEGRTLPASVDAALLETSDQGDYVEEKYALDVGDGVVAPMFVLIPKTPPPYKAILAFHGHGPGVQEILGHYPNAEKEAEQLARDENYAQALAREGYLVCAVEQRGFGERITDQYNQSSCRHLAFEYLLAGRTLLGERLWDGMLALSYLEKRGDVLSDGMGVTGNSGGGTTTLFLAALDDRISVCVPTCYFNSFKDSILAMEHCECNYVPHILEYVEMGDLAALVAPRPMLFIGGLHDDIYPVAGTYQQYPTVENAYKVLDASDHLSLFIHPGGHAYHQASSIAWFKKWL